MPCSLVWTRETLSRPPDSTEWLPGRSYQAGVTGYHVVVGAPCTPFEDITQSGTPQDHDSVLPIQDTSGSSYQWVFLPVGLPTSGYHSGYIYTSGFSYVAGMRSGGQIAQALVTFPPGCLGGSTVSICICQQQLRGEVPVPLVDDPTLLLL